MCRSPRNSSAQEGPARDRPRGPGLLSRVRGQAVHPAAALAAVLALGACTVAPPSGPTVMALPAKGKSFAAFRNDDAVCRHYADRRIGYAQPGQAATNAAIGSAVVGTALGAVAGAAIGSVGGQMGAGAAIGGATGLLGGSLIGAGNAGAAAGGLQQRYNIAYTQCMYAKGNSVTAQMPGGGYGGYPPPTYGYPPPGYYPGGGWYR